MTEHKLSIVERGAGEPLVVIPGIQGRWEYTRPAVDALAASFRVITFPLADEPSSGFAFDAARGFDSYADQVLAVLNERRIERATICGISFGGLIALRFAAAHPDRVLNLVLVSTPGPGWHLKRRHELYARMPWLAGPLFLAEAPWRLRAEVAAAFPVGGARRRFAGRQLALLLSAPLSLPRLAARARLIAASSAATWAARITCPTLIVTGEPTLDHVVPANSTTEYHHLVRGAVSMILERTGHLGSVTKPDLFASRIRDFINGQHHAAA